MVRVGQKVRDFPDLGISKNKVQFLNTEYGFLPMLDFKVEEIIKLGYLYTIPKVILVLKTILISYDTLSLKI